MHDAHPPITAVREAVARALAEDLTPLGDLTSVLLPPDLEATALLVPRAGGVLAGRLCAEEAFRQVDPTLELSWSADDGDRVTAGAEVGRVSGRLAPILTAERTALNFLGHLSGVATLTARFVDAVAAAGGSLRVWDTRKTTPGLRALEKAAVRAGGDNQGQPVGGPAQDNHLELFGIAEVVARARRRWPGRTVQVSAPTCPGAGWRPGADALLDNMAPDQCGPPRCGPPTHPPAARDQRGVTLESIADYVTTGADMVSIGFTRPRCRHRLASCG